MIPPELRDNALIFNAYNRVAPNYERHNDLVRTFGLQLLERLNWMTIKPATVLDLGCGSGWLTAQLAARYPKATVIGLDGAFAMARQWRQRRRWQQLWRPQTALCARADALPLADQTLDLVVSHLMLPACDDLDAVLAEVQRVLRPDGLFLFTSLGPDTLVELRRAWAQVDDFPHVSPFIDMHDLGDALIRQGFADPIMDTERLTLTYGTLPNLFRELRQLGEINSYRDRRQTLTGKHRFRAMTALYDAQRQADGRYPVTCELIYGHGWKVIRRPKAPSGPVTIPVAHIKRRFPGENAK